MFKPILAFATLAASLPLPAAVLYDGTLGTGPTAQGWSYQSLPAGAVETVNATSVTVDTTGSSLISAGYFGTHGGHPSIPVLDRTVGFTLTFDVRIGSESHANNDRSGFSVIALGSDKQGIEIGFWADEVWAQNDSPPFTHGEGAALDTTTGLIRYDLSISGDTYILYADGDALLTGAVRDYSALNPVYDTANFLFLGDNTTSAASLFEMSHISVVVPEPSTSALIMAGLVALWRRQRP